MRTIGLMAEPADHRPAHGIASRHGRQEGGGGDPNVLRAVPEKLVMMIIIVVGWFCFL
jgi:hypothetical protein